MMHWLLRRLERDPRAVFSERELHEHDAAAFLALREQRLLRRRRFDASLGIFHGSDGARVLTVVENADGSFEAFDEDDSEFDPIPVSVADLARWQFDLKRFRARFREANGLSHDAVSLGDRFHLLGRGPEGFAVVLGLLPNTRVAEPLLTVLPKLVPPGYAGVLVLCPSYEPLPAVGRALEAIGVHCDLLELSDPFTISPGALAAVQRLSGAAAHHELAQQSESFRYSPGFRSISMHGKRYSLTTQQAQVIELLYRYWRNQTPDVSLTELLDHIGTGADEAGESVTREKKLQATFRHAPAVWKDVLRRGGTRGTMRLNLPLPGE